MFTSRTICAIAAVALALICAPAAQAATSQGVVISNGTVQLGVNADGSLNYDCAAAMDTGCPPDSPEAFSIVGLRYQPLNLDSTAPGCACEGWGVADAGSGLTGYANQSAGTANVTPVSLTNPSPSRAVVTVDITDDAKPGYAMRVTHDYHPSPLSPNLFEDVMTITNTGTQAITDLRFRRNMDWDIEPTPFAEWVTNQGTSPQLVFSSDDGFAPSDALAGPSYLESEVVCGTGYTGPCSFTDLGGGGEYPEAFGPSDHGGLFDFAFGALAANASKSFTTYYGAAPSETAALAALQAGGAQVYSLGESSCGGDTVETCSDEGTAGVLQGKPATFMFGFVTTTGDLSITKTDSADPVTVGGDVTWTLTVTNNGPEAAAGVQVTDELPAGVTFKSATPSDGTCEGTTTISCNLGSIANGASESVTIVATADELGTLSNTATVEGASSDQIPGNNSDTETTTVVPDTTLAIGDATVDPEGDAGTKNATFTVTRSGDTSGTTTVSYATSNGSATADDYTTTSGTLTFNATETTKEILVPVIGDTLDEADETFIVTLSSPSGAGLQDGTGIGTIVDDDAEPSLAIGDATVDPEGTGGTRNATFAVTLSAASGKTVTVGYATAPGTATAADFTSTSGTLVIPAGATSGTVTVPIVTDAVDEDDETFTVGLSSPANATIADASGTGTIVDDDPPPTVSVADASVAEGDSGTAAMTFTVSLSAPSSKTVTVDHSTADGTATQPADYAAAGGTLTFDAGQTSRTVTVQVAGDTLDEIDETLTLTLASPSNATLADAAATGTILDDDGPALSISDVTVNPEGDSGTNDAVFTVSLSAASAQPVSVTATTADGTAVSPGDYAARSAGLTIPAGETSATFAVAVAGDTLDESDEQFTVGLSAPVDATISDASGTGTIVDDDTTVIPPLVPAISVGDVTVSPEGDSGTKDAVFTVSLSAATTVPVSVVYATSDGTAVAPADYTAASGTLAFAAGETSKTVAVAVNGDTADEADETFRLLLTTPSAATIADGDAAATIVDDDEAAPPETDVPGRVRPDGLFCGTQHRGRCVGLKIVSEFDGPGNASWTLGAYNPKPGKGRAGTAAKKVIRLGTVKRTIKAAGKVTVRFKLKGRKADRLLRKVRRAGMRSLRLTTKFTPAGTQATTTDRDTIKLRR